MNQGQLNELTTRLDVLIERTEPVKDEMYNALRSYAEENSALLREVLAELKALKTPTQITMPGKANFDDVPQGVQNVTAKMIPADAVGPVTVETVQTLDSGKAAAKKGK